MFNLNFQDPATFSMEKVVSLHHHIQFYLVIVLALVFWLTFSIINDFGFKMVLNPDNLTNKSVSESLFFRASTLTTKKILHGTFLEVVWTTLPTFVLLFIAIPSFSLLYLMDFSEDCVYLTIKIIGHQWYWSYELNDPTWSSYFSFDSYLVDEDSLDFGAPRLLTVDNALFLPTNLPIRFIVTSVDVLHCWAVPSFGLKVDAVPGRLNKASAVIRRSGIFFGQCSELCGVNHGFMPICIYAVDYSLFAKWSLKCASSLNPIEDISSVLEKDTLNT